MFRSSFPIIPCPTILMIHILLNVVNKGCPKIMLIFSLAKIILGHPLARSSVIRIFGQGGIGKMSQFDSLFATTLYISGPSAFVDIYLICTYLH